MRILLDTSDIQTITFIPRSYPDNVDYTLIEEGTDRVVTKENMDTATVLGRLAVSDKFVLQEDKFYSIDIYYSTSGVLVYRDKIFVTNQDVRGYSINNGRFVEDETRDNSYIIYGEDITPPDTMTLTSVTENT
jgi:hypothetical protein